jgi:peptidoglycan/LPS O-acetylase OafA/YrhL
MLTVLAIMFSKFEWNFSAGDMFFPGDGYSIPPYTRPSLVFAVSAISILALEATVKANAVVTFMAKYSLALYCLHLFVVEPVRGLVSRVSQSNLAVALGSFVLVILTSYALAMLLRVYVKEEIIM